MNWKLPDLFRNPLDFMNTNKKPPEQVNGELLDDEEDDLGIKLVQHKGTVPFRRVESSVHTFVNVALPADLDRLHRHQCNIRKWRKSKEFWKLQEEYINSGRTVQQLTRNINEMELLRARVIEEDLPIFDQHLNLAKEKAKASINEFLEIHDEGLKSDGSIVGSLDQRSNKDNPETVGNRLLQSSVSGKSSSSHTVDHFVSNYHGSSENVSNMPEEKNIHEDAFVQLRGNRLVIESSCSSRGDLNEYGTYEKQVDDTSSAEEADESNFQILELESRQEEANVEEWWDKLRKDIVDLNTVMNDFSSLVYDQGKMVDDISSNIENAETNIKEGKSQLRKATILKAAMFPVLGAVVGGVVGGPIGMVAGFKLGSVTTGLAAAGVTGTIIGYQGGKALKKKQEDANSFEMKEIKQKHEENDNVIDDDTTR